MIYLDYSANTPADPRVAEAFLRASLDFPGNPNSKHPAGQAAANALSESRNRIAELLSVLPEELIFTSGATESNNLALLGSVAARRHVGRHIISTALEHPSVSACLSHLQENGYEIDLLPILSNGRIDLEALSSLLRKDTCLVALSAVDSELGTVQPLAEAAAHIRRFSDCHFHVDATQSVGKTPVDFSVADSVSFAPHKFYGLTGSGVLYKKKGIPLLPQLHGGESDSPYRSGTPALAEIKALECALELALSEQVSRNEAVRAHNAYLRTALSKEKKVSIDENKKRTEEVLYEGGVIYKDGTIQLTDPQANATIRNPKLLLQEFTINRNTLSKLKMGRKSYSVETGSADIDYTLSDPILNNYMGVEQNKELKMVIYIMHETIKNMAYSYTLEIQDGQNTHAEIISGYKSRKEKE